MTIRQTFTTVSDGDQLNEGYFNGIYNRVNFTSGSSKIDKAISLELKNHGRQLIDRTGVYSADGTDCYGDAYIDASGRNDSVTTANTTAEFSTNKYRRYVFPTTHVVIEATSLNTADFAINNCSATKFTDGKWVITCSTGTEAVKRAQIYKTLFFGTDGTDARIKTTYVTGITAIKTSTSRDVGKRAYYADMTLASALVTGTATYTGTFADTTTNSNCSAWFGGVGGSSYTASFEMPSGVTHYSNATTSPSTETGTDTSADEKTNPATCILKVVSSTTSSRSGYVRGFILCSGSVSWAYAETGAFDQTVSNIDFYTTHNVPLFTLSTTNNDYAIIEQTIPAGTFSSTISSAIGSAIYGEWESGSGVDYKLFYKDSVLSGDTVNDSTTTQSSTLSGTSEEGHTVTVRNPCVLKSVTKPAACTATRARLIRNSVPLETVSFSGNVATFAGTTELLDGDKIMADNSGATYTLTYTTSYPFNGTNLILTSGSGSANVYNILTVTTESYNVIDSGWLSENILNTFTAFVTQPHKMQIKLKPKSSSPTAGYPSIKSFVVRAE